MTWDLFGREKREAAARNEAKATMSALDETVNGPTEKKKSVNVSVYCNIDKRYFVQDPQNPTRWICGVCRAVVRTSVDVWPA